MNSFVKVKVLEIKGNTARVRFTSWHAKVEDTYNWDFGKSTPIPGYGIIPDEWAKCLEKAGRAKSYQIETGRWNVRDQAITADATVDLGDDFDKMEPGPGVTFYGRVFSFNPKTHGVVGASVTFSRDGVPYKTAVTTDEPHPKVADLLAGHTGCFIIENVTPTKEDGIYTYSAAYRSEESGTVILHGYYEAGKKYPFEILIKAKSKKE